MNRIATLLLLTALLWVGWSADAQPVRNGEDVIWARDVDGATLTFDGALDEDAWQQAQSVRVTLDNTFFKPGGGWQLYRDDIAPPDPVDATIYFLRDGNELWMGVDAKDKSIGGTPGFFEHDGVVMAVTDRTNRTELGYVGGEWVGDNWGPNRNLDEFFYSWLNLVGIADTVGIDPFFFGTNATDNVPDTDKWDARTVVDGVSNDDFNGTGTLTDDVGYTMEIKFNLDNFGYDMTDADGDQVNLAFGIYDLDYNWPLDEALSFRARAWWQNPWGNNHSFGTGFVYGRPDVTINSGAVPEITEPAVRLTGLSEDSEVEVDGVLDEGIWEAVGPVFSLRYKMTPDELDQLPGHGPYYTGWFRPGGGEGAPPVVDPSTGTFTMFYQGTKLYIGLDTDDAAINGQPSDDNADGLRFNLRNPFPSDSVGYTEGLQYPAYQFFITIDSTGAAHYEPTGADTLAIDAVRVAASLKGASTAADPSDIDTGYQIELEIDLSLLDMPYDLEATDRQIWWSMVYLDSDALELPENSYGTRTWFLGERAFNANGARTYLDPTLVVSSEDDTAALPRSIELRGNYPNPFRAETRLSYSLPQAGDVTVYVYDVLGREVAQLDAGQQAAGANSVVFDGRSVAAGLYLYRVDYEGAATPPSATGRMVVLR